MPFIYDPNEEDQQNQQAPNISGENTTVTNETTNKNPTSSKGSGSFTNLQSYMDANKDQQFGQQVAGKVEGVATDADQASSQAETGFKQRADQSAVNWNPELVDRAANDSANFVKNQQDVDAFSKIRDAQYKGPTGFAEASDLYMPAQQKADKAKQVGTLAQSESGRFGLLDQFYKRADYGRGQKNLDNLLVQNDPNARGRIQGAAQSGIEAGNRFQALTGQLNQYGQQKASETANARAQLQDRFLGEQGVIPQFEQKVQSDYQNLLSGLGSKQTQYQSELQQRQLSPEIFDQLTQLLGPDFAGYNVDYRSYLNRNADPTLNQSISRDDQARLAALESLMNRENTIAPNSEMAGTYDPSKQFSFKEGLAPEIQQRKAVMDAQIAGTKPITQNLAGDTWSRMNMDSTWTSQHGPIDPNTPLPQLKSMYQGYLNQLKQVYPNASPDSYEGRLVAQVQSDLNGLNNTENSIKLQHGGLQNFVRKQ